MQSILPIMPKRIMNKYIVILLLTQVILLYFLFTSYSNNETEYTMMDDQWYFLHFHKGAGTQLCAIMRNSPDQLKLSQKQHNHNCNSMANVLRRERLQQKNQLISTSEVDMCWTMQLEFEEENINMIARETWFDTDKEGYPCLGTKYVTIIREPISRIMSHIKFEGQTAKQVLNWLDNHQGEYLEASKHVGTFAVDNFYIRMLLFDKCFFLPLGEITLEHLEQAKAVLDRFFLVIPLDKWDEGVNGILGDKFHWNTGLSDDYCPFCSRVDRFELLPRYIQDTWNSWKWKIWSSSTALDEQLINKLIEQNKYDIELYQYAQEIFPELAKASLKSN